MTATTQEQLQAKADGVNAAAERLKSEMDKRFDQRDNELAEKLNKQIREGVESIMAEMKANTASFSVPGTEPTGNHEKDFSIGRACYAMATGDWSSAGVEQEVFRETSRIREKLHGAGVAADGGNIVPSEQARTIIDRLRQRSIIYNLGPTTIPDLDFSPLILPRLTTSLNPVADEGPPGTTLDDTPVIPLTESTAAFDQVMLSPHRIGSITYYTMTLLKLSHPSIDAILRDDMAKQMALELDIEALVGDGTGAHMTGIAATGSVNNVIIGAAGASMSYRKLQAFPAALRNANAHDGSLKWVMSPQQFNQILLLGSEQNTAPAENIDIARRILSSAPEDRILGREYYTTTVLPATLGDDSLMFGNWEEMLLATWGGLEIEASKHYRFNTAETAIRGIMYADVDVKHPQSFVVSTAA